MGLRKPSIQLDALATPTSNWKAYDAELVTPLFGGGVSAGTVDLTMPFRAASIRGQLRFWWRVANGPFANTEDMFKRECAVWGGLDVKGPCKSRVRIRVEAKALGASVSPFTATKPAEKYALGPAYSEGQSLLHEGAVFRLLVACEQAIQPEVEKALRWWASFGGLGARTRRGAGAIRLNGLAPVTPAEVEGVQGKLLLRAPAKDAPSAWVKAVGPLQKFRQGEHVGRNEKAPGSQSPAGRSRWPEPDTLRELAQTSSKKHAKREVEGNYFPRAAFGLPMVFHFQGAREGEPQDHMLVPVGAERMASPLILRPYWNGEAWQPAALLLPSWQAAISRPLAFKSQRYSPACWPSDAAARRVAADKIKPMQGRGDDALSAFMTYFAEAQ